MTLRALAAAALAAVAAGCGGDDGGDSALAARADPICARANAALSELAEPQSIEQLLGYVEDAGEIVERRRDDLRALDAGGDDEEWQAFLAANDRAIAAIVDVRESTVTGRGGEAAIRTYEEAEAEARRLADELGLSECASEPPPPAERGDGETAPAPTAPEQSSWAARADAICGEAQARIDALPQPTDPLSAAAQLGQTAAIVKEEVAALRELEPPAGQRESVERFLAALGRGANALDRLIQATTAGDQDAVDRFVDEGERAAQAAQVEADALGLQVCGRG